MVQYFSIIIYKHKTLTMDERDRRLCRLAMAIQENGTDSLDYFAMLRGWTLARE